MREMIYKPTGEIEILSSGTIYGYKYFIISMGTHPCRYVETQADRIRFIKINEIDCHGGITWADKELPSIGATAANGIFIGWDYRHGFDYLGFMEDRPAGSFRTFNRKWTTAEILEDVKDVINQLINIEKQQG